MMTSVRDQDPDEELIVVLDRIFSALDPVPDAVSEAAKAAFTLRDLDAELMPLVESMATTPVRGDEDSWISFAVDDLELDLGSRRERHGWHLVGQITGAIEALTVHTLAGFEPIEVDEHGRFRAAVSAPTVSFRMTTPDGRRLRTQWVTL